MNYSEADLPILRERALDALSEIMVLSLQLALLIV